MSAIIRPVVLLAIIALGYAFKRLRLFGPRDYRVVQTAEFDIVLPGAITYSFAANPHSVALLWVSGFALVASLVPPLLIFVSTRRHSRADRAFVMLNGSGFNIGCFTFPMVQALVGGAGLVPAAMFDVGNCVMVAAGTNVLTQSLLHIEPGRSLADQEEEARGTTVAADSSGSPDSSGSEVSLASPATGGDAASVLSGASVASVPLSSDRDARRLRRRDSLRRVIRGFITSPSFDVYMLMIVLMIAGMRLPEWVAEVCEPFSDANAFCAMLMVGMLTELPASRHDVRDVLEVLAWRLPCGILLAAAAWTLLPFGAVVREAVVLCCLAPTAIFSTMFTDRVLGNARLAGFTLSLTAVVGAMAMVVAHLMLTT